MRIDPRSASELIRAAAILLVRIVGVHPGVWTQDARSELRTVALDLAVEEVLKGEVAPRQVTIQVEQRRADAVMEDLGIWFGVALEPGLRFVALSASPSRDPVEVLREGPCDRLLTDPVDIAQAKQALELETRDPPIGDVLRDAWEKRAQAGPIFARWLWDRAQPEAMRSANAFARVADLVADDKTEESGRETLANLAYQRVQETQPPAPEHRAILARALVRVLGVPKAAGFHSNAEGVLLRNLLGLDRGQGHPPASVVFARHADEWKAALKVVRARPAGVSRDRLLAWLEGP